MILFIAALIQHFEGKHNKNHKYYNIDIKCNWNRRGEDVGNIKSQKRLMMKFKI